MTPLVGDAATVFGGVLAIFLLANSRRTRVPGARIGPLAVVPMAIGVSLAIALPVLSGDRAVRVVASAFDGGLTPFMPLLGPVLIVVLIVLALALGEMGLVVIPERISEIRERRPIGPKGHGRRGGIAAAILVGLLAAGTAVGSTVGRVSSPEGGVVVVRDITLPGPPMDIELIDQSTGYLSVATGEVYLMHLGEATGDEPEFIEVAAGLVFPRGVAALDGVLYVAELGELACEDQYPTCFSHGPDREREIIAASNGTLWAFDISSDLTLTNKRQVAQGFPIVTSEHGLNDVEAGSDGAIYMSVGGVDWLSEAPEQIAELHPNSDLLGTIVRIEPANGDMTIHARGLRNVYGFDFDSSGRILAVDNDGFTLFGWRPEMIVAIDGGEDFGYPFGSSAGVTRMGTPYIRELTRPGSAGVEWLEEGPWESSLLVGSHDHLTRVRMGEREGVHFVRDREAEQGVLDVVGYVTVIEQRTSAQIVVGVTGIYGGSRNHLLVIDLLP